MAVVRPAVAGQFVLVSSAIGVLIHAFVSFDFSVLYVASNSNSALPTFYRVAALWGAHEGSLLLWVWILAVWTLAVAMFSRNLPASFASRVMGVLGHRELRLPAVHAVHLESLRAPAAAQPADGRDLNPVLQDPALAIHPPLLYMGYVGFAVAFAFACAAMLEGKLDQAWARWTRPWTTLAWCFLSVGIALGSWWAYYELGWGGYWFWDPVENASFMPWLVGTALIHSLAVTEKRGLFKSWTLLLAILAFSLSLLGTFLVRSGVLVSVHSFAADPARGMFILAFLIIMIGGALDAVQLARAAAQIAGRLRSDRARSLPALQQHRAGAGLPGGVRRHAGAADQRCARAAGDFGGRGLLHAVMFPYLALALVALVSIGIHAAWKRGQSRHAAPAAADRRRRRAAARPVGGARRSTGPATGCPSSASCSACWVIVSSLFDPIDRWRRKLTLPRAVVGMTIAHIGLGVCVIAISTVESYSVERDVRAGAGRNRGAGPLCLPLRQASSRSKGLTTTACARRSRCCATDCRSPCCIPKSATTGCNARS